MFARSIYRLVIEKSYFPKVKSVTDELRKSGILRIILGLIMFVRFFEITFDYSLFYGYNSWFCVANLILIILFTVGFSVPLVTALLLFFVRFNDAVANTSTLGTTILMQTLFVFLLMNSGQYFSVDNILLKRQYFLSRFLRFQYNIIGKHTTSSLTFVYFFAFFVYGLISFGALLMHVQDYFWINGLTVKSLLSNSYLSLYYNEFRWFETNFPNISSVFSIVAGILQSIFQFFMIFLVFSKIGTFFVKWWGMQFFLISLFVINLSYLPHVEIILWLLILFPSLTIKRNVNTSKIAKYEYNNAKENAQPKLNTKLLKTFYSSYSVLLVILVFTYFPFISKYTSNFLGDKSKYVRLALYRSGLEVPSVFNVKDLSMGDHWMVLYRKEKNANDWELVPITSESGERLTYNGNNIFIFSNHNSDFLYFGTTLLYRRNVLYVKDYKTFHEEGVGYHSLTKRIAYDYKKERLKGVYHYKITVYKSESSKVTHHIEDFYRHEKHVVYYKELTYDGLNFIIDK